MIRHCLIVILICSTLQSYSQNSESKVYDFPQQEAEFPGGMQAMYQHFFRYVKASPRDSLSISDYPSKVYVFFIVDTLGVAKDAEILRDQYNLVTPSILEAIQAMPAWGPAQQGDKKVPQRFKLPINIDYE